MMHLERAALVAVTAVVHGVAMQARRAVDVAETRVRIAAAAVKRVARRIVAVMEVVLAAVIRVVLRAAMEAALAAVRRVVPKVVMAVVVGVGRRVVGKAVREAVRRAVQRVVIEAVPEAVIRAVLGVATRVAEVPAGDLAVASALAAAGALAVAAGLGLPAGVFPAVVGQEEEVAAVVIRTQTSGASCTCAVLAAKATHVKIAIRWVMSSLRSRRCWAARCAIVVKIVLERRASSSTQRGGKDSRMIS